MAQEAMGFYASDDDDDDCSTDGGWISWLCNIDGHEFFAEIDEDYIRDNFNLYGLKLRVQNYERALDMILGDAPDEDELMESEFPSVYRDATDLYGLIHARYILSPRGLQQMKDKFLHGVFGQCPRVLCDHQYVLPVGLSEELHAHRVRVFCPRCQEAYEVQNGEEHLDIDGGYFATSFPHIFLQAFINLVPLEPPTPFFPKVFGFRVNSKRSTVQLKLEAGEYGSSLIPSSSSLPSTSSSPSDGARRCASSSCVSPISSSSSSCNSSSCSSSSSCASSSSSSSSSSSRVSLSVPNPLMPYSTALRTSSSMSVSVGVSTPSSCSYFTVVEHPQPPSLPSTGTDWMSIPSTSSGWSGSSCSAVSSVTSSSSPSQVARLGSSPAANSCGNKSSNSNSRSSSSCSNASATPSTKPLIVNSSSSSSSVKGRRTGATAEGEGKTEEPLRSTNRTSGASSSSRIPNSQTANAGAAPPTATATASPASMRIRLGSTTGTVTANKTAIMPDADVVMGVARTPSKS